MKKLFISKLRETAILPKQQTEGSVGYDLSACLEQDVIINADETLMIGTGFAIALEPKHAAFIYARSGLGIKQGIIPANCVGVIDSDYRGEVMVGLRNTSKVPFTVKHGDRIAQLVIIRCETPEIIESENLDDTERGAGGFGSTG
jgi:dUTP pyrophosphatase